MQQKVAMPGSRTQGAVLRSWWLSMNRKVGQASRLSRPGQPRRTALLWPQPGSWPRFTSIFWRSGLPMNRPIATFSDCAGMTALFLRRGESSSAGLFPSAKEKRDHAIMLPHSTTQARFMASIHVHTWRSGLSMNRSLPSPPPSPFVRRRERVPGGRVRARVGGGSWSQCAVNVEGVRSP